jgi:ElaA protein
VSRPAVDPAGPGPPEVHVGGFDDLDPRTAYLLWQLRASVFVVEQDCVYLDLDGRDLERGTRHVWAGPADRPIGYLRVLDDGAQARIGRVVVARSHRGRGVSDALMRAALDVIGDRASRLDAQSPMAGWYAGYGYRQDGAEFVEDGIRHVPMLRGAT